MRLLFLIGVVVWQASSLNARVSYTLRSGINKFSYRLLEALADDDDNLVLSPVSANVLLAMTTSGARGDTKRELLSRLDLTGEDSLMLNGYQAVQELLTNTTAFEFHTANIMYLAKDIEPNHDFIEGIKTIFRSQLENINFGNSSRATKIINDQIAVQTKNHIKDLVTQYDFTNTTRFALVNGVYFKATWEAQFPENNTRPRPFHVMGEYLEDVLTMSNSGIYRYGVLPDLKAKFVQLPFSAKGASDQVCMIIILPDETNGIGDVIREISWFNIDDIQGQVFIHGETRRVKVQLPKFKIESTIDLKDPFIRLGMGEIFTDSANFTGIVASPPLKVDKIVQKVFIDINEKGNLATAVTKMPPQPSWLPDGNPIDFIVDHPFIALIMNWNHDLPLIISLVVDPTR